jgi:hypothetical protein
MADVVIPNSERKAEAKRPNPYLANPKPIATAAHPAAAMGTLFVVFAVVTIIICLTVTSSPLILKSDEAR